MTGSTEQPSVTGPRGGLRTVFAASLVVAVLAWISVALLAPSQLVLSAAIAGLTIPACALPWMAAQAAAARKNLKNTQETLENIRLTDITTDLPTAAAQMDRARAMVETARNDGAPLSAVLMDLDHLADVNARHSREGGDTILANVAEFLRLNVQPGVDLVARTAGPGFMMLLPQADHAWTVAFAERLRGAIANRPVRFGANMIPVSASFGVAALTPDDAGIEALLQRAGTALAAAKSGGRNKIEVNDAAAALAA